MSDGISLEQNKKKVLLMNGTLFHMPKSPEEKPYLIGSRCVICNYTAFPPKEICPVCLKRNTMKEISLSRVGKVNTFAISRVSTLSHKAPYVQAYIDLPDGPRLFSIITDCEPTEEGVRIGMDVELVIETVAEDEEHNEIIGYKFRPIRE